MKIYVFIILICIFATFCKDANPIAYKLHESHVTITSQDGHDFKFRFGHKNEKTPEYCGINFAKKCLEVWDIEHKTLSRVIPYSQEGPNGISDPILKLFYHNRDSIFIITVNNLYILSDDGIIVNKFNLDFSSFGSGYMVHYNPNDFQNCYYSPSNQLFYFSIRNQAFKTEALFDSPLFASLDINTGVIHTDFPHFPLEIKGEYYPPFSEPLINFLENKVVYSFVGVPHIWEYYYNTKQIKYYPNKTLKSTPSNKHFGFNTSDQSMNFVNHAINYFAIVYNHSTGYFLRYMTDNTQKQGTEGGKRSIIIYDQNYNITTVKTFLKDTIFPFILPYQNGFLIRNKSMEEEDSSNFIYVAANE